jgi:regulatory protein
VSVPVLTGITPDPRQPGYRVVDVDRGRFASLPAAALAGLTLEVGRPIGVRVLAQLTRLADTEAAFRTGVRAVARRAYAAGDLRRRLIQRQHPAEAVDAAIERLAARGLLDDRRFALFYAAARAARGRGPSRLLRDLLAQGVERRVAEAAIQQALLDEGIDPVQAARVAARRRAAALRDLSPEVRRRRLTGFLVRRGFAGPHLRDVVREACAG